jgi:hypothetical protein
MPMADIRPHRTITVNVHGRIHPSGRGPCRVARRDPRLSAACPEPDRADPRRPGATDAGRSSSGTQWSRGCSPGASASLPLDEDVSVQELVSGNEAALDRIDGEAELLERRKTEADGVARLAKHHVAGDGVPPHRAPSSPDRRPARGRAPEPDLGTASRRAQGRITRCRSIASRAAVQSKSLSDYLRSRPDEAGMARERGGRAVRTGAWPPGRGTQPRCGAPFRSHRPPPQGRAWGTPGVSSSVRLDVLREQRSRRNCSLPSQAT